TVQAGDVVVLPAGTGHCKLEASADFLVVGAYPPDQDVGISRVGLSAQQLRAMQQVTFPASDPLTGRDGPLARLWRTA
ncbi:MAG TPA: cupin, partial [Paraburkholderia sp.]|nr:cupin [Paraburkholderia sp.]